MLDHDDAQGWAEILAHEQTAERTAYLRAETTRPDGHPDLLGAPWQPELPFGAECRV